MSALVPATVLVVVGTSELALIAENKPPVMKPVIAGFIVGIGLYGITGIDTRLGNLFCTLIIVGSLLTKGPAVFKLAGGIVK